MAARLTAYVVVAIVAVTLIAGLIVGAQREDNFGPVDLIIYNARLYRADGSGDFAEALAVRGNTILRVGSNREIKRLARKQTTIVDAHGGTVLPGFNDSHVHLMDASRALAQAGVLDATLHPEPPTRDDRLRAIATAIAQAHKVGITSVQDVGAEAGELELYDEIRRAGDLRLRIYSALAIPPGFTERDADALDAIRRRYLDDPLLKVGAVTLVADGAIETHTAGLLAPYANRLPRGQSTFAPGALTSLVMTLDRRGWQILIGATGDAAVRDALDAYADAVDANPAPSRGRRHRIEHIELVDPADVPRFGELGVIAAMQPVLGSPMPQQVKTWVANLGPDRAARTWPYRSIRDLGGPLAFGSDWPTGAIDPRLGMQVVLNRATADGTPEAGWSPEQRIPLAAIVDAYTRDAAYASFDEHRKGRLAPGMLADIVVLSADIFSLPPERLLDAVVEMTIFDGQVVYTRDRQVTE